MATTKPISVLILGMTQPTEGLAQLASEGHHVFVEDAQLTDLLKGYDVIIGPRCWRYLPDISDKWLPLLLKEARAAQPKRIKKEKVKKGDKEGVSR